MPPVVNQCFVLYHNSALDSMHVQVNSEPRTLYTDLGLIFSYHIPLWGFPGGSEVKVSAWNAGDPGSIPGSGRSPGEGNGNRLQNSCLENPMEGGAW